MQLDALHRRVLTDARQVQEALADILPVRRPSIYASRKTNLRSFIQRLNRVTKPLNIHNYIIINEKAPKGRITFTGLWLPVNELPWKNSMADVRVEWHLHPTTRQIQFTPKTWRRMRFGFWGFLMHELLHRHQDLKRGEQNTRTYRPQSAVESIREEQEYLGDFDEIEAYSHDAAMEMLLLNPKAAFAKALAEMRYLPPNLSTTYNMYVQTFASIPEHAAMSVFERKLEEWFTLMKAQQEFYTSLELDASWDG